MSRTVEMRTTTTKPIKVTLTLRDELVDRLSTYARLNFPNYNINEVIHMFLRVMFLPGVANNKKSWPQSEWACLPLLGAFVTDRDAEHTQAKHDLIWISSEINQYRDYIVRLEERAKHARAVLATPAARTASESAGQEGKRLALVRSWE